MDVERGGVLVEHQTPNQEAMSLIPSVSLSKAHLLPSELVNNQEKVTLPCQPYKCCEPLQKLSVRLGL